MMERSKSTIFPVAFAKNDYQPRRRTTQYPSTSSSRGNMGNNQNEGTSAAPEEHSVDSPTTTTTETTDGGIIPPSRRPAYMSGFYQRFLRALCQLFLPRCIVFTGHQDPSPILALSVCNRGTPASIEEPVHRWHGRIYLVMKDADVYPSKANTFIDLRWSFWTAEEPASPVVFQATYRGKMSNPGDIQTPQRWHKDFMCSKYVWALDFELGIPLEHWNHPGRGECSLVASVSMGPEADITHRSFSSGDRAKGWSPQLQHKLPLEHVSV